MSLINSTATEALDLLAKGQITSVALTSAYLQRIADTDDQIGAFLRVDADAALARAAQIDQRRQAKQPLGKLAGLPVAVKDVLCDSQTQTTCGSQMLSDFGGISSLRKSTRSVAPRR